MKKIVLGFGLLLGSVSAQSSSLTLYTGRSKALVEPLIKRFEQDTGIKVQVRFGTDAQILSALQEEGSKSPADLFWGNSAGALVATEKANLFNKLSTNLAKFAKGSSYWLPVSYRFRTLAYNTEKIKPDTLPESVLNMPSLTQFKGKIGWTPTYSAFQDFIGALIATYGETKTKTWLGDMKKLEPKSYPSNPAMLEAMRTGEIDIALTNHYYIERYRKINAPIAPYYFKAADVGNLELPTGIGILKSSKQTLNSIRLINYLLGEKAQQFFTGELFEYPVTNKTIMPSTLLPFDTMAQLSPKVDYNKLGNYLDDALRVLREVGLL